MKYLIFFIGLLIISITIRAQQVPNLKQQNNKYALLNKNNMPVSDYYSAIYDVYFGVAVVRNSTKFGAINQEGKIIIPAKFEKSKFDIEYTNYLTKYCNNNPNDTLVKNYLEQKIKDDQQRIKDEEIVEFIKEASSYYDDENYNKAIISYQKLLKLTSGDFDIYNNLGLAYYATENNDSAIIYFEKALIFKKSANTIYRLAYAYANIEEYDKSIETFDKMGSTYSNSVKRGKANTYHKMEDHKNAYKFSSELCEDEPNNYSNYYNLSFYALFANKPKEAITAAQKTLELKPEATGVYSNLVLGYVLNNEFDKAKPIFIEWKDKQFDDDRTWKEVFLADIADLEKAGITHKDFAKVRELLK